MKKRILLADDHAFLLAGMFQVISSHPELEVVAQASDGIQAISLIKQHRPDCAVLDQAMPGATGLEVVFEARRWVPETRFVIVTGTARASLLDEIRRAGVHGVFLKSAPAAEVCAGVHAVAMGGEALSEAAQKLLDQAEQNQALTARELEVLQAIARGLSNTGASQALGVSAKTIDSHRTNLMRKLGVNSTASLLVRAMRDGLIDVTDST
ncbi:MAG: response regulator [Sedimentitalea sp.]